MSELSKKDLEFMDAVERNTPEGYQLVCGWPLPSHEDYKDWIENVLNNLDEDEDMPNLMGFRAWQESQEPDDELGFSWQDCELCGAKPGDRYKATAIKLGSESYAYEVCGDCLQYIANGDLPQEY